MNYYEITIEMPTETVTIHRPFNREDRVKEDLQYCLDRGYTFSLITVTEAQYLAYLSNS